MTENVYIYAKELFSSNEKKYKKWADTMIYYITTEQFNKALKKVADSPISMDKSNKTVDLGGYFKNNIDKVKYLEYKNKDYYIGSGNKIVVQKRMKQSGMRWSIDGAPYMAVLGARYESNRWNNVEKVIFNKLKAS